MSDNKPKEDKDLRVRGSMQFEIDFIENPDDGQFRYEVRAQTDKANMMVAYSLVATRIQAVIDNDKKETDKKLKMSSNDRRLHAQLREYCSRIAGHLSRPVYDENIKKRDARIVLPENDIIQGA